MLQLIWSTDFKLWNVQHVEYFTIVHEDGLSKIKAKRITEERLYTLYQCDSATLAHKLLLEMFLAADKGKRAIHLEQLEQDILIEHPDLLNE